MKTFPGKTLSWSLNDGAIELALDRAPATKSAPPHWRSSSNSSQRLPSLQSEAHALIISSARKEGFCAGADLRELYRRSQALPAAERLAGVRDFLERIHRVMNAIDAAPLTTIAAVHGVTFGGGFELALTCDLIVADKMARFCFPELRLGLIPGFGGIPRLKRDLGNAVVRDLLLTGRSINATKAQAVGLVSQVVAEGDALRVARATAAQSGEIRPRNRHRRQTIHQANPARRAAPRNRHLLRPFHAARGGGWPAQIRRNHGRSALSAVAVVTMSPRQIHAELWQNRRHDHAGKDDGRNPSARGGPFQSAARTAQRRTTISSRRSGSIACRRSICSRASSSISTSSCPITNFKA